MLVSSGGREGLLVKLQRGMSQAGFETGWSVMGARSDVPNFRVPNTFFFQRMDAQLHRSQLQSNYVKIYSSTTDGSYGVTKSRNKLKVGFIPVSKKYIGVFTEK